MSGSLYRGFHKFNLMYYLSSIVWLTPQIFYKSKKTTDEESSNQ